MNAAFLLILLAFAIESAIADDIFLNETFVADYLPIDNTGKYKLFFWLFKSRDKNPNAPLVIFLNGGPGSSGQEVVLAENGPYRVSSKDLSLSINPYSYTNTSDVLYLDQPIGTGFSTCNDSSRIPLNQSAVAEDLVYFFTKFYDKYPEYTNRRVFFTGQSFAGHYIPGVVPTLARLIPRMNVKGVSIGNGAISLLTYTKYNIYAKYMMERGLLDTFGYIVSGVQSWVCAKLMEFNFKNIFTMLSCAMAMGMPIQDKNRYDYTTVCNDTIDCYDFQNISQFLKKPEVLERLNSPNKSWVYTSEEVNAAMMYDNIVDYSSGFTELLAKNIAVTLYYGEKDYICNYEGGLQWLNELNWDYTSKLVAQKDALISDSIGTNKGFSLVNFVRIRDAGHFVTMNRPEVAPYLMDALVGKGKYKFKYSRGLIEVSLGVPEQKVKLLVATKQKVLLLI